MEKTEREWGFAEAEDYKWVEKPKDLPYLGFYGKLANIGVQKGTGRVVGNIQRLLSVVAKYRFENDYYGLPIEFFLFKKVMPYLQLLTWTSLSCQNGGDAKYSETM